MRTHLNLYKNLCNHILKDFFNHTESKHWCFPNNIYGVVSLLYNFTFLSLHYYLLMPVNRTSIPTWNGYTEPSADVSQIEVHSGQILNK